MRRHRTLRTAVLASLLVALSGCQSAYYGAWEKLGWHKRDIMVSRVQNARDSQEKAKDQFKSALDRFRSVVHVEGGDLQAKYDQLNAELESCKSRADDVHKRIASVKDVSEALFREWQGELGQYKNPDLRRASEQELRETRQRYDQLITLMERAESKMQPVLDTFSDQVLFLKHNLNARAVASLQGVSVQLEADINKLIADMNKSIDEANAFIKDMGKSSGG